MVRSLIVALFSDVHGNLPALDVFLLHVEPVAERFICLGDTVNYGPWNDECLERIATLPGICMLEGNHERLFLGLDDIQGEVEVVQQFFSASRSYFTRRDLISDLPNSVALGSYMCTHTIDGRRIFADTPIEIDRDWVIGHSHYQYLARRGGHVIVNPGSIGQNRDRIDRVQWALFDTDSEEFEFGSAEWDVAAFIEGLRLRKYPPACIAYYERKHLEARR